MIVFIISVSKNTILDQSIELPVWQFLYHYFFRSVVFALYYLCHYWTISLSLLFLFLNIITFVLSFLKYITVTCHWILCNYIVILAPAYDWHEVKIYCAMQKFLWDKLHISKLGQDDCDMVLGQEFHQSLSNFVPIISPCAGRIVWLCVSG